MPQPAFRRSVRTAWASAALLVVGVALALLAAEGVLRVLGFEYRLYPTRIEFGYPDPQELATNFVPHDRLLWVEPDHEQRVARARREKPVLTLMGDSCTEFARYDDALVRRIAERDGFEVDFVNLGTAGWSSFQGLEQMRSEVSGFDSRVVTIYYGWNDHWRAFGVDDATAARLNRSILFPLQDARIVQLLNKLLVRSELVAAETESQRSRVPPGEFRENLRQMVEIARSHGAEPVLLTAPTSHRRGREPDYLQERWLQRLDDLVPIHRRYVMIVREVAAETDASLCDLFAVIGARPDEEVSRLFLEDGIHLTDEGAEVVGEELYRCLEHDGLIERLARSR